MSFVMYPGVRHDIVGAYQGLFEFSVYSTNILIWCNQSTSSPSFVFISLHIYIYMINPPPLQLVT